jgi:hypothetical protein
MIFGESAWGVGSGTPRSARRRAACVIVGPHKETIAQFIPKTTQPYQRFIKEQHMQKHAKPTEQAKKYLLANWPTVEKMARDVLATGSFEDGQIKLVML